jgi:pimeloyl-ACP methyl ester carboxylesterase
MNERTGESHLDWPVLDGHRVERVVASDGTSLRVVRAGGEPSPGGPPRPVVVCLHGFPQNAAAWRRLARLAGSELDLVLPDLRGYSGSDLAVSGRYDLGILVDDLTRVIQAVAPTGSICLVAHDWGGPIAWRALETLGDRVRHYVCTNAPHLECYVREVRTSSAQRRASWYTALFQIPGIEYLLTRGQARPLRDVLRRSSTPGTFSEEDVETFIGPLAEPARLRAALRYYRAASRALVSGAPRRLTTPTTLVWGERDRAVLRGVAEAVLRDVTPHAETVWLPEATHWVPDERPDVLLEVLRRVTR